MYIPSPITIKLFNFYREQRANISYSLAMHFMNNINVFSSQIPIVFIKAFSIKDIYVANDMFWLLQHNTKLFEFMPYRKFQYLINKMFTKKNITSFCHPSNSSNNIDWEGGLEFDRDCEMMERTYKYDSGKKIIKKPLHFGHLLLWISRTVTSLKMYFISYKKIYFVFSFSVRTFHFIFCFFLKLRYIREVFHVGKRIQSQSISLTWKGLSFYNPTLCTVFLISP